MACAGNITEPEDGAYANIVVSKELATMHKPENLSFAEAVSLGVGMATIGQAMYWIMKMRLPSPDGTPEPIAGPAVFVYGGSSATGSLAIQAAKRCALLALTCMSMVILNGIRSGYKVYTACSPSNFDLVKSRGADAWFDYNQTTCADDILAAVTKESSSSIGYIIDCIGNDASGTLCASILSPAGGHYHSIKPPVPETFKTLRSEETVTATTGLGYAMAGESFELPPGTIHPADLEQGEFAKEWAVLGEKLLAAGKIRPHPVSVREGGLEAVVAAIEEVRGSGPRGVKIVCTA